MAVIGRGFVVLWVFVLALGIYLVRRTQRGSLSAQEVERLRGEVLADTLQRLGATYVKFGQILGSRPDLLGPGYIAALARLQDGVEPARFADIERVLAEDLAPEQRARLVSIETKPIAAASVAQVHRARLDDGTQIALKVQRPLAEQQIERDLSLLTFGAKVLDKIPSLHLFSLPGAVEQFGVSLRGQLNFESEAANNRRFAANFAEWNEVRVPSLIDGLCTRRVLAMEFIEGVKASQPEKVGGDRKRLAAKPY